MTSRFDDPSLVQKTGGPMMDNDAAPLLTATPLYGTAAPTATETVIFDENAIPHAMHAGLDDNSRYNNNNNNHGMAIHPTASHDDSAALYSDGSKVEDAPVFRDVIWGILWWMQFAAMIYLGIAIAPTGYSMVDFSEWEDHIRRDPDTTEEQLEELEQFLGWAASYIRVYPLRIIVGLLFPAAIWAFLVALVVTTKILRPYPKFMVTICLLGILVDAVLIMLAMTISSMSLVVAGLGILVVGAVGYYINAVWRLIPFSAANLAVSLEGIHANCCVYNVAFALAKLGFFWMIYWIYVFVGVEIYIGQTYCPEMNSGAEEDQDCPPMGYAFLLLVLSCYWTSQVINNTIQVTVAGVVATWCFDFDDAMCCCSPGIWSSLYRSCTYSFGSICFGSLLQAIVGVVRLMVDNARRQREESSQGGLLLCLLDCFIRLFENILEYFNQWSYVFVGIYGYSYLESGRMVMELFRARGWTSIIADDLVGHVLAFTTFSVGILNGICSMFWCLAVDSYLASDEPTGEISSGIPQSNESYLFGPIPGPQYWALGIGFVIGCTVCSVMMNVVRGAVNTLIVCWADSPSRLEANHPEATQKMREAWTSVYPDSAVQVATALPVSSVAAIPVALSPPARGAFVPV